MASKKKKDIVLSKEEVSKRAEEFIRKSYKYGRLKEIAEELKWIRTKLTGHSFGREVLREIEIRRGILNERFDLLLEELK